MPLDEHRDSPSSQTQRPPSHDGVGLAQSARDHCPSSHTRLAEVATSGKHCGAWVAGSQSRHSPSTQTSPSPQFSPDQLPSTQTSRPMPPLDVQRGVAVIGLHSAHAPARQISGDPQSDVCQVPLAPHS
jgi:hypothetical protein